MEWCLVVRGVVVWGFVERCIVEQQVLVGCVVEWRFLEWGVVVECFVEWSLVVRGCLARTELAVATATSRKPQASGTSRLET